MYPDSARDETRSPFLGSLLQRLLEEVLPLMKRTWKTKLAAGLIAVTVIASGCSDSDPEGDGEPGSDRIETETEIPGVDAPEVEVDE